MIFVSPISVKLLTALRFNLAVRAQTKNLITLIEMYHEVQFLFQIVFPREKIATKVDALKFPTPADGKLLSSFAAQEYKVAHKIEVQILLLRSQHKLGPLL